MCWFGQRNHRQLRTLTRARLRRTNRRSVIVCALWLVAGLIAATAAPIGASTNSSVPRIDNTDRAQVAATYRNAITANLQLSSDWNGDVATCRAGTVSNAFTTGTLEAINWFRSMAGLENVVEDPDLSANAQRAALMMQAQNSLSHSPDQSWNCYSPDGAMAAATSNLTLGINGVSGVLGQIQDPGASNLALGHRRWLLFPELETVGVGNTSRASSVQVVSDFGPRSTEDPWVAWPPAGFVPDDVVFERWSISYAGAGTADLRGARVRVTENGRPLAVTVLPVIDGFGDPALGFELPDARPATAGDTIYRVNITGISVDGRAADQTYAVTAFDAEAASYSCAGRPATILGSAGDDELTGTGRADVIVGLGGNDTISGLGGNDVICGGAGSDLINGGSGNDRILGGSGSDVLRGAKGSDTIFGGAGKDTIYGQHGNDRLIGGSHADSITGGAGNDLCWGYQDGERSKRNDSRRCELGR